METTQTDQRKMTQQDFDAASQRIRLQTDRKLAEIRRERESDARWHAKSVALINRKLGSGKETDLVLQEVKDAITEAYSVREQRRRQAEDEAKLAAQEERLKMTEAYAQWVGSRESNRSINAQQWLSTGRRQSGKEAEQCNG